MSYTTQYWFGRCEGCAMITFNTCGKMLLKFIFVTVVTVLFWCLFYIKFFKAALRSRVSPSLHVASIPHPTNTPTTVYPKKYAHGFCFAVLVVVIHWLIFPYPTGLLHWHCGNLTIAPVPAKQPWWIWINTSCEFIMNDCIATAKQSTTKPCAYFLGYTVWTCNAKEDFSIRKTLYFAHTRTW